MFACFANASPQTKYLTIQETKGVKKMNYISKLKEYCSSFPREMEKESMIQIKKLQRQGFSNE